jgi:hypothetical protein
MMSHRLFKRWHALAIVCLLAAPLPHAAAQTTSLGTGLLAGWAYVDRNNDGILAFDDEPQPEIAIPNVEIKLFSVTGNVETLLSTKLTDEFGRYFFNNLAAGTYTIKQTQPVDFVDGKDTLGTMRSLLPNVSLPGSAVPGTASNNQFSGIELPVNVEGDFYNFGELGLTAAAASKRYLLGSTPRMPSPPPPDQPLIPEPATAVLVLTSCAGLCGLRRRRQPAFA